MPSRTFHSDPIGDVWYDSAGAGGVASYGSPSTYNSLRCFYLRSYGLISDSAANYSYRSPDEDSWGHTGAFYVVSRGSTSGGNFVAIEDSYGHKNTGVKS